MMQPPALGIPVAHAWAFVAISAETSAKVQLGLRFIHVLAGILWVGLLYFFTLVNLRFVRELDAPTRLRIYPRLMRPALWWFRWASVVTVLAGIWYWMTIVTDDKQSALDAGMTPHAGRAIGSFFIIWTVTSFVMIGIFMMGKLNGKGPLLAVVFAVLVAVAAWIYLSLNWTGWESNRQLCIGIGGGLGWVMMNNVWGVLWRAQKRILRWTESNPDPNQPMPPEIQRLLLLSTVTARTNFWLTFPMLFFMVSASHYVLFLAH